MEVRFDVIDKMFHPVYGPGNEDEKNKKKARKATRKEKIKRLTRKMIEWEA